MKSNRLKKDWKWYTRRLFTISITVTQQISPQLCAKLAYYYWRKTFRHPYPEKELSILEKAKVTHQDIEGRRIQLYTWGNGRRILLCPGWNGRATQYHQLINTLIQSGYEVLSIDPPGHGQSEGNDTSILDIARVISEVAEKHRPIYGFVGHSAGAMAGFSSIAQHKLFDRAVFIAMPNNSQRLLESYCQALKLNEQTCDALQDIFLDTHGANAFVRTSPELQCENISIPCLLIHDERDTAVPISHSIEVAEKLAHGLLFKTQRYGHFRILNAGQVVDQIRNFFNDEFT